MLPTHADAASWAQRGDQHRADGAYPKAQRGLGRPCGPGPVPCIQQIPRTIQGLGWGLFIAFSSPGCGSQRGHYASVPIPALAGGRVGIEFTPSDPVVVPLAQSSGLRDLKERMVPCPVLSGVSDICKVLVGLETWGDKEGTNVRAQHDHSWMFAQGSCCPGAAAAGADLSGRGNAE